MFIYLGQTSVLKAKVDSFLLVADHFKIKNLSQEQFSEIGNMDTKHTKKSDNNQNSIENHEEETSTKMRGDTMDDDGVSAKEELLEQKEDQKMKEQNTCETEEETAGIGYYDERISSWSDNNIDDSVDQIWKIENPEPENVQEKKKSQKKIKSRKEIMKNLDSRTCDECDKVFSKRKTLNYHKFTVHSNIEYPCGKCEYKATRPDRLRVHIQSKHDGTKFSCPHCQKLFNFKTNCTAHIQSIHEKVKYDCSNCEQKYTDRATLRKHFLRKHSERNPAICQ